MRRIFRLDRDRGITFRTAIIAYISAALVIFGMQVPMRSATCVSALACTISFAKAPVWAMIWPFFVWKVLPPQTGAIGLLLASIAAGCSLGFVLDRRDRAAYPGRRHSHD